VEFIDQLCDYKLLKELELLAWQGSAECGSIELTWRINISLFQQMVLMAKFLSLFTESSMYLSVHLSIYISNLSLICTHPQISLGKSSQGEWGGRGMWHAWERRENCKRFWWESPKERDHLEDQGVGAKMGSEWILGRLAWGLWIGFDWLWTGTGGGCCECGYEPSGFCATELVSYLVNLSFWSI
jgi:hypothetical protein